MTVPNVTIVVEPGAGSVVYYQPLAKETVGSTDKCKIGLVLDITNNELSDIEISMNPPFLKFPNIPQISPIGGFLLIPSGETRSIGMTGGSHNGGAGQHIIWPLPPPLEISIVLQFDGFDSINVTKSLQPYSSPIGSGSGYKFLGKPQDLFYGEFWQSPDSHHYGGNQIFAHDLSVLAWNWKLGRYDNIKQDTDGSSNDQYLVWEKPVYAMASGEVRSYDNDIDDYPFPRSGFPDPQFFKYKYCGNGFRIQHGTDIVTYCHMKKGSLNPALTQNNAQVNEGDFLGVVGNSGNSTEPHLHIDAVDNTSRRLRPILFRDIQVISVDALTANPSSPWVHVNGKGLPAVLAAVWPSTEPIPEIPVSPFDEYDVPQLKALATLIAGVLGDRTVTPKGRRGRPVPSESLRRISSNKIDVLLGLALTELASIAYSNESRKRIQEAGISAIEKAIVRMRKEYKGTKEEGDAK